jgi:mRNA interferase RelE/StbE
MDIILSKDAQKFLENMQTKQARQVAIKIKELGTFGHMQDSKMLKGGQGYYRVDVGEFRIIYQHQEDTIVIYLIGKRNDDEIYKLFKRKNG